MLGWQTGTGLTTVSYYAHSCMATFRPFLSNFGKLTPTSLNRFCAMNVRQDATNQKLDRFVGPKVYQGLLSFEVALVTWILHAHHGDRNGKRNKVIAFFPFHRGLTGAHCSINPFLNITMKFLPKQGIMLPAFEQNSRPCYSSIGRKTREIVWTCAFMPFNSWVTVGIFAASVPG